MHLLFVFMIQLHTENSYYTHIHNQIQCWVGFRNMQLEDTDGFRSFACSVSLSSSVSVVLFLLVVLSNPEENCLLGCNAHMDYELRDCSVEREGD